MAGPQPLGPLGDAVVQLEGVSLCYRLAKHRIPSFKEYAIHLVRGALTYESLWALQDIDLTVRRGERVAIIGRNGAGKSSLLKVVSGVLKPTRGRAVVTGEVAPILALGTGFDDELTGFENIYLNALLLGHSRRQIEERVEEIIRFSGIEEFINSPVRNYSSGMLARLGFAVATAWTPDLLILDEVMGVGDAHFVGRSMDKIAEMQEAGTALLLVSHNLEGVRKQCERGVWIDHGRVQAEGPIDEVLERYAQFNAEAR